MESCQKKSWLYSIIICRPKKGNKVSLKKVSLKKGIIVCDWISKYLEADGREGCNVSFFNKYGLKCLKEPTEIHCRRFHIKDNC